MVKAAISAPVLGERQARGVVSGAGLGSSRLPKRWTPGRERREQQQQRRQRNVSVAGKIDKGVHLGYESWNTVQSASRVNRLILPEEEVGIEDVKAKDLIKAEESRGGASKGVRNAEYFTLKHGVPTIRKVIKYGQLLRQIRQERVDKVIFFTWRNDINREPVRLSRVPCMVVYHDRSVAQCMVPEDDVRLQLAMENHGVTVELTVEPMEGYLQNKAKGGKGNKLLSVVSSYVDETSDFGKAAVLFGPLVLIGVLYALSQVKARMSGDAEDRKKMNIAKDEEKKAWKEQERLSELKKEAEVMAFKGYEAEAIIKRLDRLDVPYDREEIEEYVLLAKEGKLPDPNKRSDDDDNMSFRSGGGGGDDNKDETQRFLKSAVKVQRVQDKRDQKLQQARLRKVGNKMKQRGVKFQYLDEETVTFKDVAGLPEVVYQLQEIVDFFQNPQYWRNVGARVPKGVLLEGPPGNGKTLMARAVAGEAGVSFLSINASEFVEMFIGVGAARVRDVFTTARQLAPAIVFIDELDAVGRKRGGAEGNEERDQTVNQLLSEIDGFEESTNIVIMAATNRVDILDEALVRPGRFDRKVRIDLPEVDAREAIFMVHANKRPLGGDVEAGEIAKLTSGMSGAEIADVVNQGSLIAAREDASELNQNHFLRALKRGQLGDRIDTMFSPRERELLAIQSAGICLALTLLPALENVETVSIECYERLPLGRQNVLVNEERRTTNQWTDNYYRELLVATLAGYAADQVRSTGSSGELSGTSTIHQSHLHMARHVASQLVMVLGVTGDSDLPACPLADLVEEKSIYGDAGLWSTSPMYRIPYNRFAPETLLKAEQYRQTLLDDSLQQAKRLIESNRDALDAIVDTLLSEERIEGERLQEIIKKHSKDAYSHAMELKHAHFL
jgi:cell division protease FtsH